MNLSVIIPWRMPRQSDRREIAQWCFERYKYLWPDAEFVFSDSGDEIFSRGKSINKGIVDCTGDYCIVTDADYLFGVDLAKGIINDKAWTVAIQSENYYFIEEGNTNLILRSKSPEMSIENITLKVNKNPYFVYGGILAFPKNNFVKFDENLVGYGYEDNIWYICMNAVHGTEYRTKFQMFHLYHRRPVGSAYMEKCYENKRYYDKEWDTIKNNRNKILSKIKELGLYDR